MKSCVRSCRETSANGLSRDLQIRGIHIASHYAMIAGECSAHAIKKLWPKCLNFSYF